MPGTRNGKTPAARAEAVRKATDDTVRALKTVPARSFKKAQALLSKSSGRIICVGIGKSGFIGMKTAATLTSLGHDALFLHPVEALHGDTGVVREGDVVLAFSFSGDSRELVQICSYLQKTFSVRVITITGNTKSRLARLADVVLHTPVEKEGSPHELAPMASTTAALVAGDMLAAALTDPKAFSPEHFAKYHPGGSLGLALSPVSSLMATDTAVPLVASIASLSHALQEMSDKRLGVVGVVNKKGALVGIITDGDVRRFVLAHGTTRGKTAADAMTKRPKTVSDTASLKETLEIMERHKITTLFVVDEKKCPMGIIHLHTIVEEGMV